MAKAKRAVKKPVKKAAPKSKSAARSAVKKSEGKPVGRITHYFSNIEVAVVDLTAPIKAGDTIRVVGGEATDFEQKVGSMQIDHKEVKSAKKGDSVGMKIDEKVHEGYKVFKV